MRRVQRILHPTDFSPGSEPALDEAVRLAKLYDADLYLLHVVVLVATVPNQPGVPIMADSHVYARLHDVSEAALKKARNEPGEKKVRVHLETHRGFSVADEIVEHAKRLDADLVVMGTHGRQGVRRLLVGSVAEWVVRSIDRPVLTVRQGPGDVLSREHTVSRILVPIDFSEYSAATLRTARQLAEQYGASLDLIHVLYLETHPFYGVSTLADMVGRLTQRCREEMEALWESSGGPSVSYAIHVPPGRPAPVVADFVSQNDIDLVVLNSHGHGLERFVLGSTSEGILRRVECPVLTLRADGKALFEETVGEEVSSAASSAS